MRKRIALLIMAAMMAVAMSFGGATVAFASHGHHGHGHQAHKHCKPAQPGPRGC